MTPDPLIQPTCYGLRHSHAAELRWASHALSRCNLGCLQRSVLRLAAVAGLSAGLSPVLAATCQELQDSIEARIRANGVTGFTVTSVDAAASAPGQVVGTCDQGRKKLLFVRGPTRPNASVKQRPPPPVVITECADGRVIAEGSCKK